jgi:outer membrane protein assembly factor BamE
MLYFLPFTENRARKKCAFYKDERLSLMRLPLSVKSVITAIAAATVLSACSFFAPYRIDVRQGNYVDEPMLAQLKPGMTREQVRFVLGSPLVTDVFRTDRWDYVYRFTHGSNGKVEQRVLSVFFTDDLLDRIEGDVAPSAAALKEEAEPRSRVIEVPDEKTKKKKIKELGS